MSLASIQRIKEIKPHGNADALEVAVVMNYEAIIKKGQFRAGDVVCFIDIDTVLPDKPWAAFYKAKSSRVKSIKLRGIFSQGVIESLETVGYTGPIEEDLDIADAIGVTKYEAPQPQDLNASGVYGFGIGRTDEPKWQGLRDIPYGEKVDVTLKIDGQSWSALYKRPEHFPYEASECISGVGGRSFLYKEESDNNYTQNERQYQVLAKLKLFCDLNSVSLCIRGEQYGRGVQKFAINPHAKLPLSLAFYSTWLIDEKQYARKGHPLYIFDLALKLGLPTVPMLERDVVLTRELIKKYEEDLELVDGQAFEGVVINWSGGSFKVLSKWYDSRKG